MPVAVTRIIDDNDYEKLIPLYQTAAGITPAKYRLDDGDIAAAIIQLQVSSAVAAAERYRFLSRKDWNKAMFGIQYKLNSRTVTMTIASPAVVTLATHGMAAGTAFKFSTTGALPTGVVAGQTYYVSAVGGPPAGTFQFSATPGGASIITTGTQSGVHSLYPV